MTERENPFRLGEESGCEKAEEFEKEIAKNGGDLQELLKELEKRKK